MKKIDLNEIPELIKNGTLTESEAINELALFLSKNYAIFGLKKSDEDLNSEIILLLLERGQRVIKQYNPDYGSFFTFFFCFIKSLINTCNRMNINEKLREEHNVNVITNEYIDNSDAYNQINYSEVEENKTLLPVYETNKNESQTLQLACQTDSYHIKAYTSGKDDDFPSLPDNLKKTSPAMAEKILLVLALKSAFYITDAQINKVAEICHLEVSALREVIQYLKNNLLEKEQRRKSVELRRNNAFFHHMKYKSQLEYLMEDTEDFKNYVEPSISKKYDKHTKRWHYLNSQLKKGIIHIRPTNKVIADTLGMCERQVSFYIKKAVELDVKL
ncbi:MAG: hypothetical protein MJ188_08060 [Treponema sp.]|nr:hypothetical protein [Treponema sp.]